MIKRSDINKIKDYDSGILSDYGNGFVNWWHAYIRKEIDECNNYWRTEIEKLLQEGE